MCKWGVDDIEEVGDVTEQDYKTLTASVAPKKDMSIFTAVFQEKKLRVVSEKTVFRLMWGGDKQLCQIVKKDFVEDAAKVMIENAQEIVDGKLDCVSEIVKAAKEKRWKERVAELKAGQPQDVGDKKRKAGDTDLEQPEDVADKKQDAELEQPEGVADKKRKPEKAGVETDGPKQRKVAFAVGALKAPATGTRRGILRNMKAPEAEEADAVSQESDAISQESDGESSSSPDYRSHFF